MLRTSKNPAELERAIRSLTFEADGGNPQSQVSLAQCYKNGWGMKQDLESAYNYLKSASNGGQNSKATQLLSQYAIDMEHFVKYGNPKQAVQCLALQADDGLVESQFLLGECYRLGNGVDVDHCMAYKWLKAARDGGHPKSSKRLSMLSGTVLLNVILTFNSSPSSHALPFHSRS